MTPTKEVPTWPQLVERMARMQPRSGVLTSWAAVPEQEKQYYRYRAEDVLRYVGLTPEILEDARAVAWVDSPERIGQVRRVEFHPVLPNGVRWFIGPEDQSLYYEGPTLREAVAKAKEEKRG